MILDSKPPPHFYDITSPLRWSDEFGGEENIGDNIIFDLPRLIKKRNRGIAYSAWLHRHRLPSRIMKFQRIRILNLKYEHSTSRDWWDRYRDCIFTAFVNPLTIKNSKDSKGNKRFLQFYIICPEDCEMIQRFEHKQKGQTLPPRKKRDEQFISLHPALREALVVPVSCCHHLKNETVGGKTEFLDHL